MIAVEYRKLTDTRMAPLADSWEELVAALSIHRETADKFDGPLWSPVVPTAEGPRKRCNAAVAAVSAVVFDVDDGTPVEVFTADLSGEWIAYSTWSHTPDVQRFHVVLRLPEPVPADEWRETYERINGHRADWLPAVSHAYFLPQHPPGAPWFVVHS
jgi:hypothetical protein